MLFWSFLWVQISIFSTFQLLLGSSMCIDVFLNIHILLNRYLVLPLLASGRVAGE